MSQKTQILHASCVALEGRGLLILGASGAGKSSLALSLMAMGARLVADDRTQVDLCDTALIAKPPREIRGLIEARGVGILRADYVAEVQLSVIVDMNELETERLPRHLRDASLGAPLLRLKRVDSPHFAAALIQLLRRGVYDPDDGAFDR